MNLSLFELALENAEAPLTLGQPGYPVLSFKNKIKITGEIRLELHILHDFIAGFAHLSDTHDADTSNSCFSASSLFIDSNSTFSSMFYKKKQVSAHYNTQRQHSLSTHEYYLRTHYLCCQTDVKMKSESQEVLRFQSVYI